MHKLTPSRRAFLAYSAVALSARPSSPVKGNLQIGITDWNMNLSANPDAIQAASLMGFAGVQISFGRKLVDGRMPVDNPEIIAEYRKFSAQYGLPIDGTCVDRLHDDGLKSSPLAGKWVLDSIRLTKELNARVLLLPFFGPWALKTQSEMEHVGDALRDLAVEAGKSGVILGLEDTISAEDNVRIMDRSQAKNVLVYYDVGNSTAAGFDVVKEIRWLGKDRICQFHLKDNPHYLGEGNIQFGPILKAIQSIGWSGWLNLETDAHPGSLDSDMRRNLAFVRNTLGQVTASTE